MPTQIMQIKHILVYVGFSLCLVVKLGSVGSLGTEKDG